jgi:hypothetical protein
MKTYFQLPFYIGYFRKDCCFSNKMKHVLIKVSGHLFVALLSFYVLSCRVVLYISSYSDKVYEKSLYKKAILKNQLASFFVYLKLYTFSHSFSVFFFPFHSCFST